MRHDERQHGPQEVDIQAIVNPVTKYCLTALSPYIAISRMDLYAQRAKQYPSGPVWLDVPLDVQGATIGQ
jgi:acetolactate synthase-1/2/3 large subunit